MRKGRLIVLSGFSGTGKGTLVKEVLRRFPDRYALSVSATTRAPRAGEADGREYFFCSDARFEEMIREGQLLEYAGYVGHRYGTPRSYVEEQIAQGRSVILEIESRGAMQVRSAVPDAVLIYLLPPSARELERRLYSRGTESEETILMRLKKANEEVSCIRSFDYVIVNDDLNAAVDAFCAIADAAGHRTSVNTSLIARISDELKAYS